MLEGLLRHDKLGTKDELLLFLFDGISHRSQTLSALKSYCTAQLFSISRSFNGILELCKFLGFIVHSDGTVIVNTQVFNQSEFSSQEYFSKDHFFKCLFVALKNEGVMNEIFSDENVKFNQKSNKYYIIENKFPYKYFLLRNLMLSTGFLERDPIAINHLTIDANFNKLFRNLVVDAIAEESTRKKMSLKQLKKVLMLKEGLGKEGEEFVLAYEKKRLKNHPIIEKIVRISDENVEAGYDIESFRELDSIVIDKFIEVKSFSGDISFYWSKKEVETARILKDKYYLYLVDRSKITDTDYEPKMFQDPYQKIFESELWKKEITNWRITLD